MALTKNQQKVLELYMENPMVSMTKYGVELGLSPSTIYNWKCSNVNGFKDELEKRLAEKWEHMKYKASKTMEQLSDEGDFRASQYILNYHGYEPKKKIEAEVALNEIVIKLEDD